MTYTHYDMWIYKCICAFTVINNWSDLQLIFLSFVEIHLLWLYYITLPFVVIQSLFPLKVGLVVFSINGICSRVLLFSTTEKQKPDLSFVDETLTMAYQTFQQEYMQIPPITRAYSTACVLTTLAVQLDIVTPFRLYFNPTLIFKQLQFWRLVTNFMFFGTVGEWKSEFVTW